MIDPELSPKFQPPNPIITKSAIAQLSPVAESLLRTQSQWPHFFNPSPVSHGQLWPSRSPSPPSQSAIPSANNAITDNLQDVLYPHSPPTDSHSLNWCNSTHCSSYQLHTYLSRRSRCCADKCHLRAPGAGRHADPMWSSKHNEWSYSISAEAKTWVLV